ncbi:unnamed protein product [Bursaphelenchus okinawaensis]|uniref:Uncharacterized protein n=1 Tax=Bursaphelenchus okinawaensis TaxID=465554 RepID=A0A811L8S7_9BILA|nr:unnamed protein product [Bursaphelenchus okinawaensis]CAG9119946.1 unnamed protein product [Bursaphelenchus okinawaensis]
MSADLAFSGMSCSLDEFPSNTHNLINTLFAVEKFAVALEECTDIGENQQNAESLNNIKNVVYDIVDGFRGLNSAENLEKGIPVKEHEELLAKCQELEKTNEGLLSQNQNLMEKISALESSGTGAEQKIDEENRKEIFRLQSLIEQHETESAQKLLHMEEEHDLLRREKDDLEERLDFVKTESEVLRSEFEAFKVRKEQEIKKLMKEIDEADNYFMAVGGQKSADKENRTITLEENLVFEESAETAKLNTTNTVSSNVSVNMDDTLMMNPPSGLEDQNKLAIGALINILKSVYDSTNLLVQYMKGNSAVDPKEGWLEKCRNMRRLLFELLGHLRLIEKEGGNQDFNISAILSHLSAMSRTLESVTSRRK